MEHWLLGPSVRMVLRRRGMALSRMRIPTRGRAMIIVGNLRVAGDDAEDVEDAHENHLQVKF